MSQQATPGEARYVIVTGSSGLIGTKVVQQLSHDYHVIGLDKAEPEAQLPQAALFRKTDITSEENVRRVFRGLTGELRGPVASIVHLAAYYDFSGEPSDLYEKVTVRGTEHLLNAARELSVEQFLFSSTMLVHKPTEPGSPITEDSPLEAKWDYPQSKIDTEALIREKRGNIPAVFLRIAGVYTDYGDSIPVAHQIERIYEKKITGRVYPGDVRTGQSFVHLDDLTEAIRQAVVRRDRLPQEAAILIGEPETFSYDRLQRRIAALIHGDDDWDTYEVPKAIAKTGAWVQDEIPGIEEPFIKPWMIDIADDHYELDISRAHELLDWEPRHRLYDALPGMIDALKEDPEKWYTHHELGNPPADAA